MQKQFYQHNKLTPYIYQHNKYANLDDPRNARIKNRLQDNLLIKFSVFFIIFLLCVS